MVYLRRSPISPILRPLVSSSPPHVYPASYLSLLLLDEYTAENSQVFVTCDCSHLHHVQALLKEPAGGFMSQIIKVQVLYVCPLTGSSPKPP